MCSSSAERDQCRDSLWDSIGRCIQKCGKNHRPRRPHNWASTVFVEVWPRRWRYSTENSQRSRSWSVMSPCLEPLLVPRVGRYKMKPQNWHSLESNQQNSGTSWSLRYRMSYSNCLSKVLSVAVDTEIHCKRFIKTSEELYGNVLYVVIVADVPSHSCVC